MGIEHENLCFDQVKRLFSQQSLKTSITVIGGKIMCKFKIFSSYTMAEPLHFILLHFTFYLKMCSVVTLSCIFLLEFKVNEALFFSLFFTAVSLLVPIKWSINACWIDKQRKGDHSTFSLPPQQTSTDGCGELAKHSIFYLLYDTISSKAVHILSWLSSSQNALRSYTCIHMN